MASTRVTEEEWAVYAKRQVSVGRAYTRPTEEEWAVYAAHSRRRQVPPPMKASLAAMLSPESMAALKAAAK